MREQTLTTKRLHTLLARETKALQQLNFFAAWAFIESRETCKKKINRIMDELGRRQG